MSEQTPTTAEERAEWVNHVLEKDKIKDCEGHDVIIGKLLDERDRLEAANEGLVRLAREIGRREGALIADLAQAEAQRDALMEALAEIATTRKEAGEYWEFEDWTSALDKCNSVARVAIEKAG